MSGLPTTATAINTSWLTTELRTGGAITAGTTVTGVEVEPMAAGVGFMGEVARLRLMYTGGTGPATMIAKIPTQNPEVRQMLAAARVFEREARFYLDLAPQFDFVARAHRVAADFTADEYVLLLEDLGHMRIGDQAAGASVDDAAAALVALAGLHAAFWKSPRLDAITWMPLCNADGM